MGRRWIGSVVAAGVAAATMIAAAPAAAAGTIDKVGKVRDSGCAGRMIDHKAIIGETGRRLGQVELWYSSRNGGENCVITRSSVGRAEMIASLEVDRDGNKRWSSGDVRSADHGVYNSYAGGAYRTGTNRHCVRFQGLIWRSGDSGSAVSRWSHCS
ncbi:hypothetical protein [Nakamurella endophytica]|uniref:Spore-associated protein A n=1 Tax=Nakamurella endophytica TaxID=1748367 RepID=A0A917SRQ4_9ACTN|nr:hypothetical protein [Nakamurella endophytica]GGL94212.1 hypothetical protein GCM10011594_12580 [Nakamurella endophytica]